jgi:hypothetical protein
MTAKNFKWSEKKTSQVSSEMHGSRFGKAWQVSDCLQEAENQQE